MNVHLECDLIAIEPEEQEEWKKRQKRERWKQLLTISSPIFILVVLKDLIVRRYVSYSKE